VDGKVSDRLSAADLARLTGCTDRTARNWIAGRNVPSPIVWRCLADLHITLEPPARRIGTWRFPSGNRVTVSLVGPLHARRLALEWKRPLSARDHQFFERVIKPRLVKRLGEVLELPPIPREDDEV